MGKIYQGRYTAGVAAGMKMKELIKEGVITDSRQRSDMLQPILMRR